MIREIISATLILIIAIIFLNPGKLAMPETVNSMLIIGIIVSFLAFSALIFKEKSKDERENLHALNSGRFSYLAGVGALIIGIAFQASVHEIDPWLVIALCAMIFAKISSRIYFRFKM